ncbi:MAG: hypothetical protein BJ554DRAFT_1556, partial [Olpidium bornovanus]
LRRVARCSPLARRARPPLGEAPPGCPRAVASPEWRGVDLFCRVQVQRGDDPQGRESHERKGVPLAKAETAPRPFPLGWPPPRSKKNKKTKNLNITARVSGLGLSREHCERQDDTEH